MFGDEDAISHFDFFRRDIAFFAEIAVFFSASKCVALITLVLLSRLRKDAFLFHPSIVEDLFFALERVVLNILYDGIEI